MWLRPPVSCPADEYQQLPQQPSRSQGSNRFISAAFVSHASFDSIIGTLPMAAAHYPQHLQELLHLLETWPTENKQNITITLINSRSQVSRYLML